MQHNPELFWSQSGTGESLADDLRLAHRFMDLSDRTPDFATARECYERARDGHDTVDRLLRRKLPTSADTRAELGTAIARLRRRLTSYENDHN